MRDAYGHVVIVADGWSEPIALHEECALPPKQFVAALEELATELKETTQTPEACDQWLADSCKLYSAAIEINLACHRIQARWSATRVERRAIEIS